MKVNVSPQSQNDIHVNPMIKTEEEKEIQLKAYNYFYIFYNFSIYI